MESKVTVTITSFNRVDLLERTLDSFLRFNTYPIKRFIITEDSGLPGIQDKLIEKYKELNITWILNPANLGQHRSVDNMYELVDTDYIFHCEDDWQFIKGGFIEKSLDILEKEPNVLQVWIRGLNDIHGHTLVPGNDIYDYIKGGRKGIWFGFSFNPGLRRLSDYNHIKPFSQFKKEYEISIRYHELGFRTAILRDKYCRHIGMKTTLMVKKEMTLSSHDTMKFIVPIPDYKYHLWQILVQITNFREMGYEKDLHIPVLYFHDKPSDILMKLSKSSELKCNWHLYPDRRERKVYPASMKPYLMGKYFEEFPGEKSVLYNYLDPDCIFTQPMDFKPFYTEENVWFGSGTKSYTGEKYIKSKGIQLFYDLCDIVGLSPALIEGRTGWEVGAQYFIKNNTPELWFEIENKSIDIYEYALKTKDIYHPEGHKSLQAWCAEMYATQMVAIKNGIDLKVSPLMEFMWASHNINNWNKIPYYHNAGQLKDNGKDFFKSGFKTSPFKKEINISQLSASYNYLLLIRKTEETFPDLIW